VPEYCGISNILLNSVSFAFINHVFVSYSRQLHCPCIELYVRGLIFIFLQQHARYLDVHCCCVYNEFGQ
jgi:hypothetical protein